MSQNLLPAEDLSGEITVPADAGADAQGLHARLQTAFTPADDVSSQDGAAVMSAIDAARTLAAATLRQDQAFENVQERVVQLESGPDIGAIRENVRDLCEALLHITVQTKKASTESEERFESLSDAMAALSGHLAAQRQEVQANIAATSQLSQQLKQLQDEIAGQRAETAQIKEMILSTDQALRNDLEELKDRVAPLAATLESGIASLTTRMDDLEPGAASLANRVGDLESGAIFMTSHIENLQSDTASLTGRVHALDPLKGSVAQLAAEDAKLLERFGLLADEFDTAKGQVTALEDTVAALADSSIRSSQGLSVLGNALETAKTQIFSLGETSDYLAERLRIAEQVVETFTRREKILAGLHARAARTLQLGGQ